MDHYWQALPGPVWFCGAQIYERYVAAVQSPSVAVELGAWKGRSTCFMAVEIANSGKPIEFYTVDTWLGSDEEAQQRDVDIAAGRLFEEFTLNIAPVADFVNVIRSDTAAAADRFDDCSVDFLYVDASHTYEGVIRDLRAWYPKVRTGGLIAGDDWCFADRGVKRAVLDFLGEAATDLVLERGSSPHESWLQWSIVKEPEMSLAPFGRLAALRASALRRLRRLR